MRGDGEESIAFEGVGLDDFVSKFEEESNALAASREEIVNEVELWTLESQYLYPAEHCAELVDIDC